MLAVVGALESQYFRTSGRGMGHSQTEQGGLGARCNETDPLSAGTHRANSLSQLDGTSVQGSEVQPIARRGSGCLHHLGMSVPH